LSGSAFQILLEATARQVSQMGWDVLLPSTTADSYSEASSPEAGAAVELTASNKVVKYGLSSQGEFVPIAVESHSPTNRDALQFLSELDSWLLVETTEDVRASSFLFQRISVAMQRFNLTICSAA